MKNKILALMCLTITLQTPVAHAYRMIIFTDEVDPKKSLAVIQEFRSTYPFNKFEIDFQIAKAKTEQLKCSSDPRAKRMITCGEVTQAINVLTQKLGGDQALIIKDLHFHGGASHIGSGSPVMTTGAAKNTMLHEYLHTLGLSDEYIYEKEIANDYCQLRSSQGLNKAIIDPLNPYNSDAEARSKHSSKIMWYSSIQSTTPITNSNGRYLGTAAQNSTNVALQNNTTTETAIDLPMGLYPSGLCMNASRGVKTWRPSGSVNIMGNINAGLGKPLEQIVERLLIARGVRLKPEFRNNNLVINPDLKIEDSSRGSFNKNLSSPAPLSKLKPTSSSR